MANSSVLSMAKTVEDVFGGQLETFFATETKAASDALSAGLTDDEVAKSASADRKLFFAGVNKGLGFVGTK